MSNREVILQALERVRRHLEFGRALHDAAIVLGIVAVGMLLWRALQLCAGSPPVVAAAVLVALLLWVGGLFVLARRRLVPRCTLGDAAASVDARAGLKNELTTASWFLEHPVPSPWVDAQVARAVKSARGLDPAALLPLRVDWRELSGGTVAALLLVAAWLAPPMVPASDAARDLRPQPQAQDHQVQFIRGLLREERDEPTVTNLERALAVLERKTASADEKRRALLEADGAIEQQALEAAALRERLYRLAASLRGIERTQEVARALEGRNAQLAAKLLQQMAEQQSPAGLEQRRALPRPSDEEQELARLLATVASEKDQAQGNSSSAAAREAADRLGRIAQRLAAQDHWSQAAHALEQLRQAVAQDSLSSLAGSRLQASGRGSDNGRTEVAGANVQQTGINGPDGNPSGHEGSKPGAATGDAQSDAVLGEKVAPLAAQLRQEAIDAEGQGAATAPKSWFYVETKQQQSNIDLENVSARSEFTLAQAAAREGLAVRNRQIVKEYFMALRQGARP